MEMFQNFNIGLYVDSADFDVIQKYSKNDKIVGITTNPTLMKQAGVLDYEKFAKKVVSVAGDKPLSFEVFADDMKGMEREARIIASWGKNIFVKIPISNTKGEPTLSVIKNLVNDGIKVNITAILTLDQVKGVAEVLNPSVPSIISIFAGRIADTGVDPVPLMKDARKILGENKNFRILWASSRELYNLIQAEESGCDIITLSSGIMSKTSMLGKDLSQLSLETVQMFHNDAVSAGYKL